MMRKVRTKKKAEGGIPETSDLLGEGNDNEESLA